MMVWVHASVGAFLGGRAKSAKKAYGVGVVSHGVLDLFPHRDYELPAEAVMATIALGYIALRYGLKSPELAGALGGVSPDAENAMKRFGFGNKMLYPTHTEFPWSLPHGRRIESPLSQILLAAACLAMAHVLAKREEK
jgi:hypothetical protein